MLSIIWIIQSNRLCHSHTECFATFRVRSARVPKTKPRISFSLGMRKMPQHQQRQEATEARSRPDEVIAWDVRETGTRMFKRSTFTPETQTSSNIRTPWKVKSTQAAAKYIATCPAHAIHESVLGRTRLANSFFLRALISLPGLPKSSPRPHSSNVHRENMGEPTMPHPHVTAARRQGQR